MASERTVRKQTAGEELANTISHALGAALAVWGAVPLLRRGITTGDGKAIASVALYAFSLVLLYTNSAIYHGARDPRAKRVLQILDHCSIFLLILGTYIPLSLLVIGGPMGWTLCLTNAVLATVGITLNAIDLKRFGKLSLVLYAVMGWLVVMAMGTILRALPPAGVALLVYGGVAYTVGIVFYKSRWHYAHFVWHLFVLLGSILQYFCVVFYCV